MNGIILQPISRKKKPWSKYNDNLDFLKYFQKTFTEQINKSFYVNHNTESFSNYLLIPYFTENRKCFGAYFIDSGSQIENRDYKYAYNLNYDKSFNFRREIFIFDIINEVEFHGGEVNKISSDNRVFYYELNNLPYDFYNKLKSFVGI